MNNLAVTESSGEYLLFLNDDTAVLESDWLREMVSICKQDNVGAVGTKLIHKNGTIQSAGTAYLKSGSGFHVFENLLDSETGYFNLHNVIREVYSNTSACLLTKKEIFSEIGGFDINFDLFYGDGDLCLKIRNIGYDIIYTPFAKLLHDGSSTIREHADIFFSVENHQYFCQKWPQIKNGDPFYNKNLDWNYSIAKENSSM
jgi:GT2 family glycosyltransferase